MKRREFISLVGGAAASLPLAARGQQKPMPVIGLLQSASVEGSAKRVGAFLKGLAEGGFVDGENVTILYSWANGQSDRLPQLAADLVGRRVAVFVTPASIPATLAAKAATSTIPIVFATGADPVAAGVVASLNRPEGNITGITSQNINLAAKRLELLHQLVPHVKRYFLLINPESPFADLFAKDARGGAAKLGIQIESVSARTPEELASAFAGLPAGPDKALLSSPEPFFYSRRAQIIALAERYRLAAAFDTIDYVTEGGLLSYGANFLEVMRRAGLFVGRVLKGEKIADLPVEQSNTFELAVNLKTARTLGITVPPNLLALADEVVE
jgi:putative ABC transport system substrate-binding protein